MNLAVITITYNDGFKLKEWRQWYDEYKHDVYLHIIVDNASKQEYKNQLKSTFPDSVIIERTTNGGCTGAYNDGIRYALADPQVDAIMLLASDIKVGKGSFQAMYDYLYSDEKLGMVGSIGLTNDSKTIRHYGISILSGMMGNTKFNMKGEPYREGIPNMYVDYVPGGFNMSKREFYEKVGLQDDKLFMFGDEIDMYHRSKDAGYRQGVTSKAIAYHYHKQSQFQDKFLKTGLLNARNFVYLSKKYHNPIVCVIRIIRRFFHQTLLFFRDVRNKTQRRYYYHFLQGMWHGIIGKFDNVNIWYN
jgi:hypothetical protein